MHILRKLLKWNGFILSCIPCKGFANFGRLMNLVLSPLPTSNYGEIQCNLPWMKPINFDTDFFILKKSRAQQRGVGGEGFIPGLISSMTLRKLPHCSSSHPIYTFCILAVEAGSAFWGKDCFCMLMNWLTSHDPDGHLKALFRHS